MFLKKEDVEITIANYSCFHYCICLNDDLGIDRTQQKWIFTTLIQKLLVLPGSNEVSELLGGIKVKKSVENSTWKFATKKISELFECILFKLKYAEF